MVPGAPALYGSSPGPELSIIILSGSQPKIEKNHNVVIFMSCKYWISTKLSLREILAGMLLVLYTLVTLILVIFQILHFIGISIVVKCDYNNGN